MSITDNDKELRLHPRPSSDFLAAVPIKKRPFVFPRSPSPPLEPPSPILADCDVSENKPESSEPGPTASKVGGNFVQGSVVTSEVTTCESHDPPSVTSSDCGIGEKKFESSELGYDFSKSRGNPAQSNILMGKVASFESRESSSSAVTNCHITEKIQESSEIANPFSTSAGNPTQMNSSTGDVTYCEPCDLPSPTPLGCDISEKKPECLEEIESCFLSTGGSFAQVNSIAGKRACSESWEEPRSKNLNMCTSHEMTPNNQESGSNLAATFMVGTRNVQGVLLDNNCETWPDVGSAAISSAAKLALEMPGREGNFNVKFWSSEGVSVKQEDLGRHNIQSIIGDAKCKADSSQLHLNRSNWDLNTTMDAWEGSSANSLLNREGAVKCLRRIGGVQNRSLELSLNQNLFNKDRETDEFLRNYDLRENLKFLNACASMIDSNSETCLDLQLKPSFLSNSCSTSGKHDAISELPLLSLGTQPVLATSGPPASFERIVKSEPIEMDQKVTGIVLKQVKSDPCKEEKISKATVTAKMNVACSRAVKTEPPEEQSEPYARTCVGSSFHIGQKIHSLVAQSKPMHQNAGDNESKALDVACESLDLNSVLHPCTGRPNINIFNNSSDLVDKVQNPVNRSPSPGSDMCAGTVTPPDPIGIHTEPLVLVSKSCISDTNVTNPLLEACETSSLPRVTLPENLTSNGEGEENSESSPELSVQLEPSNSHPSSCVALTDEVLQNPCGNIEVVKSDEDQGKVRAEEPCESTVNTVHKHYGQDGGDYKDGGRRSPTLNDTAKGSSLVKAADSISPVNAPLSISFVINSSKEANAISTKENDGDLIHNKAEPGSSAVGALPQESDKITVRKIIPINLKDHPDNDQGLEKKLKSSNLVPANQKHDAEEPSLAKNSDSCKIDQVMKEDASKGANDRGNNRRIIYLNSAPSCLASEKKKSTVDKSISLRGLREGHFDRSFRNESISGRSRKVKNNRHYGRQIENPRSDLLSYRSRADVNANHEHTLEQRNNSDGARRSQEFSSRRMRKLKNDEPSSGLPFQRQSPGSRLQIPLGHPVREISPRCIRRDFVLLSHEDAQYERDEGIILRRERRSLSPQLRGGSPLRLPPNCTRSQQRSTHQWSPPRRSSDSFNGPQELVRRRSPQVVRLNRLRSPHEEIIVRRRASLDYDLTDVGPSREQDFPSPMRGSNRNVRRFNVIDPREIAEEEYFHLRTVDNRIQEFGVDDEFVDDRGSSERRRPIHESFRFRDEDGRNPRALGFNPDANEDFHEGRDPMTFNARFRNRLGSSSGRFRDIVEEQEGNPRLRQEQEWCDANFIDARTKRRRF